ncbi:F-box/kelch-repeat protein At3g23880-like [Rutidosis leptorrhynchoides]|uniref:F-box/kelch-repeat protein At3g23880-like n=1 Tax=Rutidosis leptorrhynchoides TaxID=125765 RepID=UPI003A995BFD
MDIALPKEIIEMILLRVRIKDVGVCIATQQKSKPSLIFLRDGASTYQLCIDNESTHHDLYMKTFSLDPDLFCPRCTCHITASDGLFCMPPTKALRLPPSTDFNDDFTSMCFGAGLDSLTNDYKVVRILSYVSSTNISSKAEVFSLKTNFWKVNSQFDPLMYNPFSVSLPPVNGAINWLASRLDHVPVILAFDLNEEVFR